MLKTVIVWVFSEEKDWCVMVAEAVSLIFCKDRNVIPTITRLADRTTSILYIDPLVRCCQSPAGNLPPTRSPLLTRLHSG